jgi:deoxycytidylate deaminase
MNKQLLEALDCELIVGIVGAVGTKFKEVIQKLQTQLELADYVVETIKVSQDVIQQIVEIPEYKGDYQRYSAFMEAGNLARSSSWTFASDETPNQLGNDMILALGVAARIFSRRDKRKMGDGIQSLPKFKHAFIVDSLKRPEEVEALRLIYGDGFVLVGVYEDEEQRFRNLSGQGQMTIEEAKDLVERDFDEGKSPHGQRVNETFHRADFFVEIKDARSDLECSIQRMVEIWFGHPFRTPTFDEYAMYMAHSAALRSADLSRQVGAVLTRDQQILSTGANDCPQAKGGLYWPSKSFMPGCTNDLPSGRDYMRGIDSNREAQLEMIEKIVKNLCKDPKSSEAEAIRAKLDSSPISDITEYGRVVHAEMEALLACARFGIATTGTTLYCTTFPCHNCAKHIIAAGVTRVVYIEPYPKSRAIRHHGDSITEVDEDNLVPFVPFTGIGPRRYFDLFSMDGGSSYRIRRKNKKSGKAEDWRLQDSRLRIQTRAFTYLDAETQAATLFTEMIPKGDENDGQKI